MYALGIDLGTTFTAAAVWRDGRVEIASLGSRAAAVPTVVVLREDGTIITGEAAERRALSTPHRVAREFKRRIGDTTPILLAGTPYSAELLMSRMLRAVVAEVSAREGGAPAAICVTHPANWGPYKIDLLQQAVRNADLDDVTLVSEPVAAAISYAAAERLPDGAVVAVYDLGGGTFDAAVLQRDSADLAGFRILGRPEGIERLGGIDVDAAVFGHVARSLNGALDELDEDDPVAVTAVARLREECTEAKEALSADTETTIPVLLPGLSTEVRLTRAELESMVRPALQDTVEALRRALRSAGVAPADLHSVLLVGGSSRMPIVGQLVGAELGRPVAVDAHPKHAVALGAAAVAGNGLGGPATEIIPPAVEPAQRTPAASARPESSTPASSTPASSTPASSTPASSTPASSTPASFETMLLPATAAGPADRVDAADVGGAEPPAEPPVPGGRTPFHDPGQARSGSGSGARRLGVLAGAAALVVVVALVAFTLLHNGSGSPSAKASTTPSATPSAGAALAAATAAGKPGPLAPVAHRGGWEDFPRNSLPALADAAKLGDIVQVDLLWTSDGVPILLRDETTVVRSKAGQGAPVTCTGGRLVVAKTTLSVLQSKCRTVSSASKNGKTYPIATLDQATAQVAADKGVWFYVQMAPQGLTPARTAGVLATLAKHGMIDRSVVGSFYPEALQQIRGQAEAAGENLRLMMYLPARSGDTALPSSLSLTALHLYGIAVDIGTATKSYLHSARAQHLVTMVWNANDEQQWEQARDFGVDEVFTDTPHAYQDWLQSHPTATTKP